MWRRDFWLWLTVRWRRQRSVATVRHRQTVALYQLWTESPRACWDWAAGRCAVTTDVWRWYTFRVCRCSPWGHPSRLQCTSECRLRIDDAARQNSRSQMTEEQCISWSTEVRGMSPAGRNSSNSRRGRGAGSAQEHRPGIEVRHESVEGLICHSERMLKTADHDFRIYAIECSRLIESNEDGWLVIIEFRIDIVSYFEKRLIGIEWCLREWRQVSEDKGRRQLSHPGILFLGACVCNFVSKLTKTVAVIAVKFSAEIGNIVDQIWLKSTSLRQKKCGEKILSSDA